MPIRIKQEVKIAKKAATEVTAFDLLYQAKLLAGIIRTFLQPCEQFLLERRHPLLPQPGR